MRIKSRAKKGDDNILSRISSRQIRTRLGGCAWQSAYDIGFRLLERTAREMHLNEHLRSFVRGYVSRRPTSCHCCLLAPRNTTYWTIRNTCRPACLFTRHVKLISACLSSQEITTQTQNTIYVYAICT